MVAGSLPKTEPLNTRPTTLNGLDGLVITTEPTKFGGTGIISSRNLARLERAGTDIVVVAIVWAASDGRIRRQAGIFQRAEDRTAPALNQSWTHLPKLGPLPGLFLFACSKFPGFAHVYLERFITDLIQLDTNPAA
jgi:hypothetical protein